MAQTKPAQAHWDAEGFHPSAHINPIGLGDLTLSLKQGWQDFLAAPTQLFFLCLVYPAFGFVLGRAAAGNALLPLVWPLLAGFALVGPVLAIGLYEISRRRELSLAVSWRDMFGVLKSPAIGGIFLLGLSLVATFVIWIGVARWLYGAFMGPVAPLSLGAMMSELLHTEHGRMLILVGNLVGAGFALWVVAVSLVSFPMMLDREVSAGEAVLTSLAAFRANPGTLIVWGMIVGLLLFAGMAFLGVGLAVVLPVLGHATWHLYRRLVV
ncbi:DUF2189 domain-containing protein [Roseococcus sp.]|uniref:DUF2189 domain-containing protein n=1 Tax=Roseococcus sp. TaxID=2109646 RepID=UPI003BAD75A2